MQFRSRRADGHAPGEDLQELVEVVSPRTNAAAVSPAENLFASLAAAPEGAAVSLEIAATADARWFLARAAGPAARDDLEDRLGVAYPQADLRRLDPRRIPGLDPARIAPGERAAACAFRLRGPEYLPLRTFDDAALAADQAPHAAQADPVLGVLGAMGGLPPGWRAVSQLIVRPAPEDWSRPYQRLAIEDALAAERAAGGDVSLAPVFLLGALMAIGAAGFQGYLWYRAGDWARLVLLCAGAALAAGAILWLALRLGRRTLYDRRLVQEKIGRVGHAAHLRVAVIAPETAAPAALEACVRRVAAAYRQYSLASGNGLAPGPVRHVLPPLPPGPAGHPGRPGRPGQPGRCLRADLRRLAPLPRSGASAPVLNTRELAGLWHLPQAHADAPFLERTTARRRLPLPGDVRPGGPGGPGGRGNPGGPGAGGGCRIGTSSHQGRVVPVALPADLLRRHLLLVAKTRRGKSSLLLRLAQHAMAPPEPGDPPQALVLVDPHRDLAREALGLVPAGRRDRVVYLDLADAERPFGINLLDVGLGWSRDKAVGNVLTLFKREFDGFWGPRMEDAFRFALLTLYEVNERLCAADPVGGRDAQYTVLQVPAVLSDPAFREACVDLTRDPTIAAWWNGYFNRLERRLQLEIINPVQTKVSRFAGSAVGRAVVGQARSTIDPSAWLRDGAIVIVNTAKGVVGEDVAALIGGCVVNLVGLVVAEQAARPAADRRRVTVIVDEFHSMPGADYESILAELSKYGANLVLATQSLATLEAQDARDGRALRAVVFSNLDGLFAFHVSAEDAAYLVPELGEHIDAQDLVALGEYRCYARLSARGERLPAFSVELDPPPVADQDLAQRLAAQSAARYGRDRATVEAALAAVLRRLKLIPDLPAAAGHGDGVSPHPSPRVGPADERPDGPASSRAPEEAPDTGSDADTGHVGRARKRVRSRGDAGKRRRDGQPLPARQLPLGESTAPGDSGPEDGPSPDGPSPDGGAPAGGAPDGGGGVTS